MAGRIFISYRREDDPTNTGRLLNGLQEAFAADELCKGVDLLEGGIDFVQLLQEQIARCDVLIAVIGEQWIAARDESGRRRLDNPGDFVRLEIEVALRQHKRVVPVTMGAARMPVADDLPVALKPLAGKHAIRLTDQHFRSDVHGLITALKWALDEAQAQRKSQAEAARSKPAPRPDDGCSDEARLSTLRQVLDEVEAPQTSPEQEPGPEQEVPEQAEQVEQPERAPETRERQAEANLRAEMEAAVHGSGMADAQDPAVALQKEGAEAGPRGGKDDARWQVQTQRQAGEEKEERRAGEGDAQRRAQEERAFATSADPINSVEAFLAALAARQRAGEELRPALAERVNPSRAVVGSNDLTALKTVRKRGPAGKPVDRGRRQLRPPNAGTHKRRSWWRWIASAVQIAGAIAVGALLFLSRDWFSPLPQPMAPPQRAAIYSVGEANAEAIVGSATWQTRIDSSGPGKPATVIMLDAQIPERQIVLTMSIAREAGGAGTHLIDMRFAHPQALPFGGISAVPKIVMKAAETDLGDDLIGRSFSAGEGRFLFGLLDMQDSLARNIEALRSRPWMGILINFADGPMQMLNIEKGSSGQRAFDDALAKWEQ